MTPENLETFLKVATIEAVRTAEGVQELDFMRARNSLLAELATVKERPFQLGMYLVGQFFRHGKATGPQTDIDSVRAVGIADLKSAAANIFAAKPTLSLVGPVEAGDHLAIVQSALAA